MSDDDNTPIAILYPQILCVPRYTQHYLVDILGEPLPAYSNEQHPPPYSHENILDLQNICKYYILLDIVYIINQDLAFTYNNNKRDNVLYNK